MPSLAYLVLLKWHFPDSPPKSGVKPSGTAKLSGAPGIGRNIILLTAVFRLGVSGSRHCLQ